jgi:hypothetical protein
MLQKSVSDGSLAVSETAREPLEYEAEVGREVSDEGFEHMQDKLLLESLVSCVGGVGT